VALRTAEPPNRAALGASASRCHVGLSLRLARSRPDHNRRSVAVLRSGSSARGEGPEDGNPSIFSLSPSREGRGLGRFHRRGEAGG
jgi:hypothetical protein